MDRKQFVPEVIDWSREEMNGHIATLAAFITFLVFFVAFVL